jgi:hypothetical protein
MPSLGIHTTCRAEIDPNPLQPQVDALPRQQLKILRTRHGPLRQASPPLTLFREGGKPSRSAVVPPLVTVLP